jgi:hypothetical protein
MKNSGKTQKKRVPSADGLAEMAMKGEDVTKHYNLKSTKRHPGYGKLERVQNGKDVQRVNVDLSQEMLLELDAISKGDNVPRQSVIKNMLRSGIDRYFSHKKLRKT